MTSIPHRFTEKSFRRYEAQIYAITRQVPQNVFIINPKDKGFSIETYCARLRDAMTALDKNYCEHKDFRWETSIHVVKFNEHFPKIQIAKRGSLLVCGTREAIRQWDDEQKIQSPSTQPSFIERAQTLQITLGDGAEFNVIRVNLLVDLIKQNAFHVPLHITINKDFPLSHLLDSHDVSYIQQGNTIIILP